MGNLCATPDVSITDEQIDAIKELINNSEHFKNIYSAIPFLVPQIAPAQENDPGKIFEEFAGDKRMLGNISGRPDSLEGVSHSCESSMGKICESVVPLAESMLAEKLKAELPENIPDKMKDKAVSIAIEKTVELSINEAVKALIDKQLKGEFPGAGGSNNVPSAMPVGGYNDNNQAPVMPAQQQQQQQQPIGMQQQSSVPTFVDPNSPDLLRLQNYYAAQNPSRLPVLKQNINTASSMNKSEGDIFKEELLFIISSQQQQQPQQLQQQVSSQQAPVAINNNTAASTTIAGMTDSVPQQHQPMMTPTAAVENGNSAPPVAAAPTTVQNNNTAPASSPPPPALDDDFEL